MSSQRRFRPGGQPEIYPWVIAWLTLALAVFLVRWRRPLRLRLSAAAVGIIVLSVVLWSGCGEGSGTPLRGTPAGTYQVTVSANAGPGTQAQSRELTVTVR